MSCPRSITPQGWNWLHRGLVLAVVLTCVACDARPEKASRVAQLVAIGVRQTAVDVADRIAARPTPHCGMMSGAQRIDRSTPFITNIETHVSADSDPTVDLEITLRVRRDADGNLALVEIARWLEHGWAGARSRELRRVEGVWYVREDDLPFVVARNYASYGEQAIAEALETWDRLVAVAPGWSIDDTGQMTLGGPLRCDLSVRGARRTWFDPLVERVGVDQGRARATLHDGVPTERALSMSLSDDAESRLLTITVDERTRLGVAEPVVVPDDQVDDQVDRSFFQAREVIRRTVERRVLPLALRPVVLPLPATAALVSDDEMGHK